MWDRHITCAPATEPYWTAQAKFSDTDLDVSVSAPPSVSRVTFVADRATPAGTREDYAMWTMHMAIWFDTAVTALDATQKAAAEVPLKAFVDSWATLASAVVTFKEFRWHDVNFGDEFYGPADRYTAYLKSGAAAGNTMPYQMAINTTLRTASRRHWGRFYLPNISSNSYDTVYGRVTNAACDTIANNTKTLYTSLSGLTASVTLVVYSHKYQAVLSVDEIHCDNVPDVVRRRRAKQASYRKALTS